MRDGEVALILGDGTSIPAWQVAPHLIHIAQGAAHSAARPYVSHPPREKGGQSAQHLADADQIVHEVTNR